MTREDIKKMLDEVEVPYEYYMFEEKEAVNPPFLVWYFPDTNNFSADGKVYCRVNQLNIELYTDQKDFILEEKLESLLNDREIFWQKTEGFLKDEELYEVLYEMEVMINA